HRRAWIWIVTVTHRNRRQDLALRMFGAFNIGPQNCRQLHVVARATSRRQLESSVGLAGAKSFVVQDINQEFAVSNYALRGKILQRINQLCDGGIPVGGM